MRARAVVSRLPLSIAHRELAVLQRRLALPPESLIAEEMEADGPGNAVLVAVECDHVTEVFTGFGRRGLPAEEVAAEVADQVERYLEAGAPVGPHLAAALSRLGWPVALLAHLPLRNEPGRPAEVLPLGAGHRTDRGRGAGPIMTRPHANEEM